MTEMKAMAGSRLRARLFGTFGLTTADGDEVVFTGKRARALIAILCLEPGATVDRGRLCELLWPGRFRAQARASLRQTLFGLKKQLAAVGPDLLRITRDSVGVNAYAVCSDLSELEAALADRPPETAAQRLLEIGARPLLGRLDFGDAFRQWTEARRAQVDQRLQVAVEEALTQLQGRERARLLDAWRLRRPMHSPLRSDARIRVAVLPLQSMDDNGARSHLAQGLFDELITSLGRIPQLLVAGRGSSQNIAGANLPLPEIARALNVAFLVQGSVQRQGDTVRAHISLVAGDSGFERWSRSYSGSAENLFGLQEDIARAVSRELGSTLACEVDPPQPRRTTASKAAYERYLQGRALTARAIGDGVLSRAVALLEASLELDPSFAACWTALAEAHACTAVYTPCLDRSEQSARMAECALKAIELDAGQGHARALLGIHRWTRNDAVGALDLAFEAWRLEPDNADVAIRLGSFLLYIGRTRQALPYIEIAIDLDPVNGRNFAMLSVAQLNLGRLEDAVATAQRMVDLGMPSMWLGVASAALGNHDLAVEQYRLTRVLMNQLLFVPAGTEPLKGQALESFWEVAAKGVCSGRSDARAAYCDVLENLHTRLPDPVDTSIVLPAIWMGHAEMVFRTLGSRITPANMFCLMSLWADIEPIRRTRLHPGFAAFAERIGLAAAWRKYGQPDLDVPEPASAEHLPNRVSARNS